ncbi:DUF6152 family protein [Methylopila turkensis]|uniref:DUF5666 domain-containing protein n=1 Tax=Methylopila turkensis TaxID=1437816 RepID=A0A9W6JP24_9HYPH|nr:DUF6152 family protein [Methylopila turkensis]GLK81150.1 hypothetical protein GCM10008174_28910 [Methylopila turkensis]
MNAAARVAAIFAIIATPALAHHGWSSYDSSKTVTIEGPVLTSSYGNPHGDLTLEHDGAKWEVVLAPPSRMNARGLAEADIAPGKTVKVEGYPNSRGRPELRAERITAGGKTVELR